MSSIYTEEERLKRREYYQNTKEQCLVYQKQYYQNNREQSLAYTKDYYQKHPEKRRAKKLKEKYGMSVAQYNQLLEEQQGKCVICKKDNVILGVDHNHKTGNIRGLLCNSCNIGLGHFHDNQNLLQEAIQYLKKIEPQLETP